MLWACLGEFKGNSAKVFVIYALGKVDLALEEYTYRLYVTDCLQATASNTASFIGGGMAPKRRYFDILDEAYNGKDEINAAEIVADVLEKSGVRII